MEQNKINIKNHLNVSLRRKLVFSSGIDRRVLYPVAILVGILAVYFTANAGMWNYPDLYSIDARLQSEAESDANSEIRIVFNQPVIFLNEKNIAITPDLKYDMILSEDGKTLTLSHKEPFSPETKYEIELKEVRGLSGLMMKNNKLIFFTKAVEGKRDFGSQNGTQAFSELQLSIDKYIPPTISQPDADFEAEPKFLQGKYIDVSIDYQIMTLFEDGVRTNSFLVSSGVPGMSTPLGTFAVQRKETNHWSGYGLWMPYSLNFSGPYYIHELPYWPSGFREGESHLGIKASHGCVRLGIGPAKYVYDWAQIGTPIYIHK